MLRQLATINPEEFPSVFRPMLANAKVYDSSCSTEARVWFIDRGDGYFLKKAPKGTLEKEAALTRYFRLKGLGAEVLCCESLDDDWLLTGRVQGEDCTFPVYMDDPKRLCDTLAENLRMLHDTDFSGCPIENRTADYLETAQRNRDAGKFDLSLFSGSFTFQSSDEAWSIVEKHSHLLKSDTLIHGDYCLPNIMLDNWRFSGFIDLDTGGVGDRHVDLFWGAWSLNFNLKTDEYRPRFFDAYGRDRVNEDMFKIIAAVEVFG